MHYRHAYHAGNFADVFKHALLASLMDALVRKDKPWAYLDTHAGAGGYDLHGDEAARTAEWKDGIGRLEDVQEGPAALMRYLELVRRPGYYPGSPMIAAAFARPGDRVICCESVPRVAEDLRFRVPEAIVHVRDGFESHALLPPKEKRGLVLIDPPFEARDEFDAVAEFLQRALARFANGIYAVWYPVKNRHAAERFQRRVAQKLPRPPLCAQLANGADGEGQMRACGLLVVNPPFGFEDEAREILAFLAPRLAQGPKPSWSVEAASSAAPEARPPPRR